MDHQRGRLLAALVAACRLAGAQRGDQPAWQGQRCRACKGVGGVRDDAGSDQHITGDRNIVTGNMPAPSRAGSAGIGRDAALRIHHVDLALVAPRIRVGQRRHHLRGTVALFQEPQAVGAVEAIDQRLRGDGTDARFDKRNKGARGEETGGNRNAELSGILIARDNRPSHTATSLTPASPRSTSKNPAPPRA